MKFSSLFRVELGRLFRSRLTWAVLGITAAAPAVGFTFYCPLSGSLNSTALANPALGGSLAGALVFALLTVLELDRVHSSHTDVLTDSHDFSSCRGSMPDSGIADSRICSRCGSNDSLDAGHGLVNRRCIPARTVCGGISAGDASLPLVFHPFHSRCLSACAKTGYNIGSVRWLFLLSLSAWRENWLLRWVNPALAYLSDDFGNNRRLMSLGWNRLFWLLLLGGILVPVPAVYPPVRQRSLRFSAS